MPEQNTNRALTEAAADEWKVLPSGLTVLVRPMPGYSGTHVIYATRFGSIDRDFRVDGREVHLPAGVAHFLEHKMFEDEDAMPLQSSPRPVPTPMPLPALTAPATCLPPPSSWTKAWMCCWAWWAVPTLLSRPSPRSRASSGRRSKCMMTAPTGGSSPACASACITATPSAATLQVRWKALQRSRRRCCTLLQGVLCPQQHGAGRRRQHQHGTDPGGLCAPRLMEARPVERVQRLWTEEPMTLAAAEKDHYNAGVQALLRHRLQGAAAAA